MKKLLFILIFISSIKFNGQPPTNFYSTYGGNGYDVGYDIKQTLDKGYIITGSTSSFGQGNTDMYLLKLDSMGVKKFETSFGGVSNEVGMSVIQLLDSSYVIAGFTSSTGVGGYDIFLVKIDKTGSLLWQKTIGGTDWDFAYSMQATADGGFIIAGTTYSYGRGNADGYIVKTDANGNVVWQKTYGNKKDDEFKSVIQTADLNYALVGYTKSYNDSLGDAWLFKIDQTGDSLKSFSYNFGLEDGFNDLKELPSGEIITAGYLTFNNSQKRDGIFNKIDLNGVINIQTIDGQANTDEIFYKVGTSNSSFGVYTVLGNSHENGSSFKLEVKLLLLNSSGNYVNGGAIGGSLDDECFSYCLTNEKSKGYAAIGYTKSYNSILTDCYLIKYDSLLSFGTSIIGINELAKNQNGIKVSPNPFSENVFISSQKDLYINTSEITSINGDVVYFSDTFSGGNINLNLLKDGIYILKITDKNGLNYHQKIVKSSN